MADVVFEVEYECTPIRHAYVTCPKCHNKFMASEVTDRNMSYEYEIRSAYMVCPICNEHYDFTRSGSDRPIIKEVCYPKCAEGAKYKREVWEEEQK